MALVASGVAIPDDLKQALSGPTKKAQGNVGNIYNRLSSRLGSDRDVLGHAPASAGNVPDYDLGESEAASSRGVNDQLYQALGGTSYQDTLNQREFNQNQSLAEQAGDLNRPGALEEALSGFGSASKLAGTGYGLFKKYKKANPQVDTSGDVSQGTSFGEDNPDLYSDVG